MSESTTEPTGQQPAASTMPMTVPAAFAALRTRHPDRVLLDDGRNHTLKALDDKSWSFALRLVEAGVRPGDRVGIQAPNGVPWAVAALAVLRIGATIVPVSTRYRAPEAVDLLERSGTGLVLATSDFIGRDHAAELAGASADLVVAELTDSGEIGAVAPERAVPIDFGGADDELERRLRRFEEAVAPDDVAFVQYTSGTTGSPKGALLRHGALIATTLEWIEATGLGLGDRYAVVAPFFHISGYKTGLLASLLSGAIVHPIEQFVPSELLELIETVRISVLQGPPTLFRGLLDQIELEPNRSITSLRLAVTGGTTVPPTVVEEMRIRLGLETIVTSYGLTEASGVVTICRPGDPDAVIGMTSGRAIPSAEVLIRPLDPPDPEGHGEIVVRSPHLMAGYLDDQTATAAAIDGDGWLRTGDLGYLDPDGNLVLTGRLTDMFIVGGFNAYPAEIEAVLLLHPGVRAAAVVGVPDDRLGEVAAAFLVLDDPTGLDTDGLDALVDSRLASFKRPRSYTAVDELPLNAIGKVDKVALRRRIAEHGC